MKIDNRTLFFGDNLEILRKRIPDNSFDLIYLDPPFNSQRTYNILFKEGLQDSTSQIQAFEDTWHWTRETQSTFEELVKNTNIQISSLLLSLEKFIGHNDMLAYLTMMAIRLIELRRVLKPTGSIFLHCDPTASHYLKILMDTVFDKRNFINEIIWFYKTGGASKRHFSKKHDIILFYSKSNSYKFNLQKEKSYMMHKYGFKKSKFFTDKKGQYTWVYMKDVWEIPSVGSADKQRLGYPTQKPERLLERIIKATTKKGDWVLDPFCGCGTTVAVAEKLQRNWVGIDITILAINLIGDRLNSQFPQKKLKLNIDGIPTSVASATALFKRDPIQFEIWAVNLIGGISKDNGRGGADKGIDGLLILNDIDSNNKTIYRKGVVQVKGGKVQRSHMATLKGDVGREKADFGILITLREPTRAMEKEAVVSGSFKINLNKAKFPKIQIISIKELLDGKNLKLPTTLINKPFKKAERTKTEEELKLL